MLQFGRRWFVIFLLENFPFVPLTGFDDLSFIFLSLVVFYSDIAEADWKQAPATEGLEDIIDSGDGDRV